MSQPSGNKPSPKKGVIRVMWPILRFYTPLNISGNWNGSCYSGQILCDCRLYQVLAFGQLTVPEVGVVMRPSLEFYSSQNIFGTAKATDFKYLHGLATRSTNLAGLRDTMFTVCSTLIPAVLTNPKDWLCHIGTLTLCVEAVA